MNGSMNKRNSINRIIRRSILYDMYPKINDLVSFTRTHTTYGIDTSPSSRLQLKIRAPVKDVPGNIFKVSYSTVIVPQVPFPSVVIGVVGRGIHVYNCIIGYVYDCIIGSIL